ncbi:hypothetical protein [Marinomonas pollencensis]|uniref:Uncharacterized protein n=1 Tax=Marinomonas pollencensis TaxID=491954 RepID=A0A3E0D9P4_9GAMM|nr:hypothetical protein [Marinomonas pollencensis]REG79370.1 hypothetical protein DFP81_12031 [Marinomonas pollencensis]
MLVTKYTFQSRTPNSKLRPIKAQPHQTSYQDEFFSDTGETPFAQAAGFSGGEYHAPGEESVPESNSETTSSEQAHTSSGFVASAANAGRVAAGTASALARGMGSKAMGGFQNKVSQTAGGRLASSIRESMDTGSDSMGDQEEEGSSDGLSPSFGGQEGWINQSGGFSELSESDQEEARQAHADRQERDPEKHTFDVEDYVDYAQEKQRERNEEIASFVGRNR